MPMARPSIRAWSNGARWRTGRRSECCGRRSRPAVGGVAEGTQKEGDVIVRLALKHLEGDDDIRVKRRQVVRSEVRTSSEGQSIHAGRKGRRLRCQRRETTIGIGES